MVTILWSLGVGVAMTLAGVCALVWLFDRRNRAMLMLCVLGVATAASAHIELGMMRAATPAEYGQWLRWYCVPTLFTCAAVVFFVRYYAGTGRPWLMWAIIFARTLLVVVNFSVQPSFNFSNIASLRQVVLFGEQVSAIAVATTRGWQLFALASMILLTAYLVDAAVQAWMKGEPGSRRKALAILFGLVVPQLCTYTYAQLVAFGFVQLPISNAPWFLGALFMMTTVLGRDLLLNHRAKLQLVELRSKLARVERVELLGQLASSFEQELSRPLNGISLNAAATRQKAIAPTAGIEALRTIIDEMNDDGLRSAKLAHRVRQRPHRPAVDIQPVRVEDVVQDVVALVRAEAESKHVVIGLRIEPRSPRVYADRVYLTQALLNMLANGLEAVQARPVDARKIIVEVRTVQARNEVEIVVQDSGPGIASDLAEKIFEPFFSTKPDGLGLGLSLSRTFVEAQGGRLWADSEVQEGAVFRLSLQSVRPDVAAVHRTRTTPKDITQW